MTEQAYFKLDPSESVIFRVAGSIFSAFVAAGKVNDSNEKQMEDKAIALAISLADKVEKTVQSDTETSRGNSGARQHAGE